MKLGRKQLGLIAVAVAAAIGGYVVFERVVLNSGLPEGLIQVNGRIEGGSMVTWSPLVLRVRIG